MKSIFWKLAYPIMAIIGQLFTLTCLLLVNWWAPLFATQQAHLPNWLAWCDTFDADLDTGNRELGWNQGYWGRVRWLYRNTAYGFDYWALGCAFDPADWTLINYVPGVDPEFSATSVGGRFNLFGTIGPIRYKIGWKAWNYFDEQTRAWKAVPWGPEWRTSFVFSISLV